ncbi:hypothetical protein ACFQ3N_18430 [Virgibacillus byunsanensis]|uniref:Uncharacterized protein n=1 Tax=Virgibacillus byunsanensis TaxID=570945 RepID=A0ABW3LPL0_9BACI
MSNSNDNISDRLQEKQNEKQQFIKSLSDLIHSNLAENKKGEKQDD